MEIHFLPVLVCAIIGIVLGSVWYSPLMFGKAWMRLNKVDADVMTDPIKRKAAQKRMMPAYFLQLALSLFQIWVLGHFIIGWSDMSPTIASVWIWAAFVMPTVAAGVMWSNESRRDTWTRFGIQALFYLVTFAIYGAVLTYWR